MSDGDRAWLLLATYVVCYDTWALATGRETLSSSYARALDHPTRRWPTILFWMFVTGHLFRFIPPRLDPLRCWIPQA